MSRKIMTLHHDGDELVLILTCDDGSPEEVERVNINEKNAMLESIQHCLFRYEGENEI